MSQPPQDWTESLPPWDDGESDSGAPAAPSAPKKKKVTLPTAPPKAPLEAAQDHVMLMSSMQAASEFLASEVKALADKARESLEKLAKRKPRVPKKPLAPIPTFEVPSEAPKPSEGPYTAPPRIMAPVEDFYASQKRKRSAAQASAPPAPPASSAPQPRPSWMSFAGK